MKHSNPSSQRRSYILISLCGLILSGILGWNLYENPLSPTFLLSLFMTALFAIALIRLIPWSSEIDINKEYFRPEDRSDTPVDIKQFIKDLWVLVPPTFLQMLSIHMTIIVEENIDRARIAIAAALLGAFASALLTIMRQDDPYQKDAIIKALKNKWLIGHIIIALILLWINYKLGFSGTSLI